MNKRVLRPLSEGVFVEIFLAPAEAGSQVATAVKKVKGSAFLRYSAGLLTTLTWLICCAAQAQTTNCLLGTTSLLEGPSEGSDSVVLAVTPATGDWNAAANADWLHLSPPNQGGIGSTNIVFLFDANPGTTRFGTLTIAGQTLSVTQAGATYVAAGQQTTLATSTNGLNGTSGLAVGNQRVFIAQPFNDAIMEWNPASNNVTTLLSSPNLGTPFGVALETNGNFYISDFNDNSIIEWNPTTSNLTTVVSSGLDHPQAITLDQQGNIYICDNQDNAIKEWIAGTSNVVTLVGSDLNQPYGVAVDAAGNVYIADSDHNVVKEWSPSDGTVIDLVSNLSYPFGVSVDGSGNLYITDTGNGVVKKWTAVNGNITIISTGTVRGAGIQADASGNIYYDDYYNPALYELPYAFVDPTAKTESPIAGNDVLPAILPSTQNLLPPFAPFSDQTWLTITDVTNGVVSFSFGYNRGSNRTANISLLGQSISVTQTGANVITWANPPPIVYGTALSGTQLDATANIAGTFSYSPPVGRVLPGGPGQTLSVTFTPNDTTDFAVVKASTTIDVEPATPVITWATPAAIVYGKALTGTQLNARANIPGTFSYNPVAGTILLAGNGQMLSVSFTPTQTADYTTASPTVTINVKPATPVITWANPATIVYGTALSSTQQDATANIPGNFSYSPPAGTVLGVGNNQILSATFTPTDTTDYSTATYTAKINVTKAMPIITWGNPAAIVYGTALSGTQLDASANIPGNFSYSPPAGRVLPGGHGQTLSMTFTPTDTPDFAAVKVTTIINVEPATPVITWANPTAIVYGKALSGTQLNARANIPGTFSYSPVAGTILQAGNGQILSVTFTPTQTADYTTASATATINVIPATPVITWANPATIVYGAALSSTQLNATANIPGTFNYSPPAGTVLGVGNNQILSATFTPTDTTDYATATSKAKINVE